LGEKKEFTYIGDDDFVLVGRCKMLVWEEGKLLIDFP
jgi:hypothetical protein